MELQTGDYVKTQSGDIGKVVHISRLTVFVAFAFPGKSDLIQAYLESDLTKIDRPENQTNFSSFNHPLSFPASDSNHAWREIEIAGTLIPAIGVEVYWERAAPMITANSISINLFSACSWV